MPCYYPIPARQEGQSQPKLWPLEQANLSLPCGNCIGCKSARASMWAQRCTHEASQWENNIFVTLTYDDNHLPWHGYLEPTHLTLFFKRLRQRVTRDPKRFRTDPRRSPRYFACGEYGDTTGRAHYHAIIFNLECTDRHTVGKDLYASDTLRELWPHGDHKYGSFTAGAANYIAQYTLKRQRRTRWAIENEEGYADADGVFIPKQEPFLRMSLRPAIGADWLERYGHDLAKGYVVSDGNRLPVPRTYLEKLKLQNTELAKTIVHRKIMHIRNNPREDTNNPERRKAAERIHQQRIQQAQQKRSRTI